MTGAGEGGRLPPHGRAGTAGSSRQPASSGGEILADLINDLRARAGASALRPYRSGACPSGGKAGQRAAIAAETRVLPVFALALAATAGRGRILLALAAAAEASGALSGDDLAAWRAQADSALATAHRAPGGPRGADAGVPPASGGGAKGPGASPVRTPANGCGE